MMRTATRYPAYQVTIRIASRISRPLVCFDVLKRGDPPMSGSGIAEIYRWLQYGVGSSPRLWIFCSAIE